VWVDRYLFREYLSASLTDANAMLQRINKVKKEAR